MALGSNHGPREQHLHYAIARLGELLDHIRVSAFIETIPVDVPPQPDFLNAVATGMSVADSRALLKRLLAIEAERGRTRSHPGAPRTLDLDLILVGDEVVQTEGLTLRTHASESAALSWSRCVRSRLRRGTLCRDSPRASSSHGSD